MSSVSTSFSSGVVSGRDMLHQGALSAQLEQLRSLRGWASPLCYSTTHGTRRSRVSRRDSGDVAWRCLRAPLLRLTPFNIANYKYRGCFRGLGRSEIDPCDAATQAPTLVYLATILLHAGGWQPKLPLFPVFLSLQRLYSRVRIQQVVMDPLCAFLKALSD